MLYTFTASLDNYSAFDTGGFITIYYLPGTAISTTAPAGFSATAQLLGKNSAYASETDNASLYNLTLTNTGGTLAPGSNIATFSILTTQLPTGGSTAKYVYSATDTSSGGGLTADFYIGTSAISLAQPAAAPEPSELALLALGLAPVALLARRKRRA